MTTTDALIDETERLTVENARLHDRVRTLEARCGALMVDADRREEKARQRAEDCGEHGQEIQHLRHVASWYWAAMGQQEAARRAIVGALGNTVLGLRHHTEPIDPAELAAWLDKAIAAQSKVTRRPAAYPTLADCLRAGGCDHDGLCDGLKAEIAGALGLTESESETAG